jgi:hypothetical protein
MHVGSVEPTALVAMPEAKQRVAALEKRRPGGVMGLQAKPGISLILG